MYRFLFRPKWIAFHVAVLVAAVGMLGLARWQWNRHLQRDEFVAMVHARENGTSPPTGTPLDLVSALTSKPTADIEYSIVTATGSYLADKQVTEINQVQNGVNGSDVIAPFQIDGGPIVIVNRGFIPDGTTAPAAPTGTLLIGGLARTTQVHQTGQLTDNNDGATSEVRLIDLPALGKRFDVTIAPIYIDFRGSQPSSPEPPTRVPPPDLSGGPPHVSYTVQWCIFSVCAVAGWVFAIKRSLRTRRRATAATIAFSAADISGERPIVPSV